MPNPMIFVDIPTRDPEAGATFYAELFGWTFNRRPAGVFHEILPGVKPNLGMRLEAAPMAGPLPRVYVMVDDPPAYLARALPFVADGRTKIITNAGGINPAAATRAAKPSASSCTTVPCRPGVRAGGFPLRS